MSPHEQLADYIQKSRAIGKVDDVIKQELLAAGWQEGDVAAVLNVPAVSVAAPAPTAPLGVTYAGFWHRVAAAIVDNLILTVVMMIITVPVILLTTMGTIPTSEAIMVFVYIIQFVVFFFYYPLMEAKRGATFGKRFIGIHVANEQGELLSFPRSIGRNVAKLLSALILGIGFLMAAFTKKKQGLHDMMAGAVVLKTARANKYRTILTIVLGTIGPILVMIFVVPILMAAMIGLMLAGTVNPDWSDVEFTESDFASEEYQFEPSVVALTAQQMDELLASTSIQQMLTSNPEDFVEGYVLAGPTIVAWDSEYYDKLSVYMPDFDELYEGEVIVVDITEVLDDNGVNVLDGSVADVPADVWPKGYMVNDTSIFAYNAHKSFALREGVDGAAIKTVSGVVRFKAPLESGEMYVRSYDFTLQYQALVQE